MEAGLMKEYSINRSWIYKKRSLLTRSRTDEKIIV